jgi:hypothetical protein
MYVCVWPSCLEMHLATGLPVIYLSTLILYYYFHHLALCLYMHTLCAYLLSVWWTLFVSTKDTERQV